MCVPICQIFIIFNFCHSLTGKKFDILVDQLKPRYKTSDLFLPILENPTLSAVGNFLANYLKLCKLLERFSKKQ